MRDTNLVNALREHAKWAEGNQWETPITLGDDLTEAADRIEAQTKEIEKLRAQLRHLCRDCDLDRLEKLAEANRAGRLLVLPCKVGDTVYFALLGRIIEKQVFSIVSFPDSTRIYCGGTSEYFRPEDIGKTFFLTREAADRALEAMKDE